MRRSSLPTSHNIRDGAAIVLAAWGMICLLSIAFVQYATPTPMEGRLPDGLVCAGVAALISARRLWRG
jgi:hypothetical protein